MIRLVLASASPSRKKVLADAGIAAIVQVSNVDEDELTAALGDIAPADLALTLAQAKARDVAAHFTTNDDLVVGCDSVFELDGVAFGKPLTPEVAFERITALSGRSGFLHTGHCLIRGEQEVARTRSTSVEFAVMQPHEIAAYIATGEPLNVAGGFTLDGLAGPYVQGIVGDPSNVIGISLPTLRELAGDLGVTWSDLWASTRH